jgi:enhancing lycopene biosynthesis protein 2
MTEAARIARGAIKDIKELKTDEYDVIYIYIH